jgi:hypothetical protein
MKKIIALILVTSVFSCKKKDIDNIPSYITINSVILDGNSTHNITDAWVYIDDNLQGVYELPANFPILEKGIHKLRVKAGIKDNGISASRIPYPFYSSYIIDEQDFKNEENKLITPIFSYLDNILLDEKSEDFEDGHNLVIDAIHNTFSIPLDEGYGVIKLTDSILSTQVSTQPFEGLPQAGAPVYLELDYKCNTQFLIGVYINPPPFSGLPVATKELLWINKKEEWNKIYVNLTPTISEGVGANSFTIFIQMKRDFSKNENTASIDNLRLIY